VEAEMNIKESNPYGRLSSALLATFESRIGATLPNDYRDYLLTHNGGKPNPCSFKVGRDSSRLHHVYGLHSGPAYCRLDRKYNMLRGRIPENTIPIADDPGGNKVCIVIHGTQKGQIYFWNHELESESTPTLDSLTSLSESFTQFCSELFKWIDPNETPIEAALRVDDAVALHSLLPADADLEAEDEYERTLIENAAIKNSTAVIQYLFERGASFRNSLNFAESNMEFFPDHQRSVDLIRRLMRQKDSLQKPD
jgi:hypothetical protein